MSYLAAAPQVDEPNGVDVKIAATTAKNQLKQEEICCCL